MLSAVFATLLLQPAPKPTLLVLNKLDNTVWITDLESAKVRAKLATGPNPNEVAISPDGTLAAISDMGSGQEPGKTLTLVDLGGNKVLRKISIEPHTLPHGIHWLSKDRLVFTSHATDSLVEVDVPAGKIHRAINTEQKGTHLVVFSPDLSRAYTVNAISGSVTALNFKTGKVIKQIPTGDRAEGISISPDGKWVACGNVGANTVSIINTEDYTVAQTLKGIAGPIRTLFTQDGKHLAVSSVGSGALEIFDTKDWKIVASVELKQKPIADPQYQGQWPIPMNLTRLKNGNLLVVLVTSHAVAEVDTKTWKVTRTFETGPLPDGIAVLDPS